MGRLRGGVPVSEREEYQVITLTDEEGNEQEFTVLEYVEVDGREYVVVAPTGEEETTPARVLRVEDEETLVPVEDEDEFNRVLEQLEDFEIVLEDEEPEADEDLTFDEDGEE
jgi:putative Holliday junction resolvase